ncbi:MAG: sulfite exporter TauE/SafE family protein [Pedosphaera sp.]|nr:sulfite exporter TauE/SafE family protein [Pedosphaera sp.]
MDRIPAWTRRKPALRGHVRAAGSGVVEGERAGGDGARVHRPRLLPPQLSGILLPARTHVGISWPCLRSNWFLTLALDCAGGWVARRFAGRIPGLARRAGLEVGQSSATLHARAVGPELARLTGCDGLNGLFPCGLVYIAAVGATATGHPLSGAAYMVCFGLGTWPMMMSIHMAGHRLSIPFRLPFGSITRAAVLLMAGLLILRGLELGIPFVSPDLSVANSGVNRCH